MANKKICDMIEKCWQNIETYIKLTMDISGDKLNFIEENKIKYELSSLLNAVKDLKKEN